MSEIKWKIYSFMQAKAPLVSIPLLNFKTNLFLSKCGATEFIVSSTDVFTLTQNGAASMINYNNKGRVLREKICNQTVFKT